MELTRRQHEFLSKLIDLYVEGQRPLHYSTVAEQLHVSPVTAYDMLRLLEERGFATSHYAIGKGGGPGRSTILFSPTDKALALIVQVAGEDWDQEEWETVKERIFEALRQGNGADYRALLDDMLLRIPETHSPMLLVTEMITAILLTVHELVGEQPQESQMFQAWRALGLPEELGLNAFAGLTVGLSMVERANRSVTSRLLAHNRIFQDRLGRLSADNKRRLSDFAREVVRLMEA